MSATLRPLRGARLGCAAKIFGCGCARATTGGVRSLGMAAVAQQSGVKSAVQQFAGELLPRTHELARGMAEHLYAAIPELSAIEDDDLRRELLGSTEANIGQVLRLLAHGVGTDDMVVPHEALEFLRGNVRRGIPLPALLRSYRLGHAWLWERWSQALQERVEDSGELAAGQDQSSAFMFAYVDKLSDALVEEFGTERERMMRSADAAARGDGPRDPRRRADRRGGRLAAARVRASPAPRGAPDRGCGERGPRARARGRGGRRSARRGKAAGGFVGRRAIRRVVGVVRRRRDRRARALRAAARGARRVRPAGRGNRGVPQLARGGAPGRAHRIARRRQPDDELRGCRAGVIAGRRPEAGAGVRGWAARASRLCGRADRTPA